jgi:amino acid transporter
MVRVIGSRPGVAGAGEGGLEAEEERVAASTPGLIIQDDLIDVTTSAALREKAKLQRHFGRLDIFFFLICTLVGLDTIGAVAAEGAQGFTWLILLGLFFFIPYALLTAELGSAFTEEGGSYIWTRLAFGRKVAAVNAVIYWISNPIWVGGSLAILALTAFKTFFSNGEALPGPIVGVASLGDWVFLLGFIWFTVIAAIVSFDVGKWIPTIGAFVRIFVLGLFTFSVALYGIQNGINGFAIGDFAPSYGAFVVLVPFLFFNYVGFELPSAAGEEMEDAKRDVPFGVVRAAIVTIVMYGGPILAILLVLPIDQVTGLGGFVDAIKTVFTVYGGSVSAEGVPTLEGLGLILGGLAAISLIVALVTSGTTWLMGADRAMAMAALDGSAPRSLGTLSQRFGTPINTNLLSGLVSTTVLVLALSITSGDAGKYFAASLGLAISTTTISYLAIFPALWKLRISHPHVPRPYKVPGGMPGAIVISVVTFAWAAFAAAGLLYPGLGTPDPDAGLIEDGFTRLEYTLTQVIPLVLFLLLGGVFYIMGRKTREEMVAIPFADEAAHDMSHVVEAPPED